MRLHDCYSGAHNCRSRARARAAAWRAAPARAGYDLSRDKLYGHVTTRKGRTEFLAFARYLRSLHPADARIAIVLDNFNTHLSTTGDPSSCTPTVCFTSSVPRVSPSMRMTRAATLSANSGAP